MTEAKDTIIREFLIQPHNRRIFNDFYKFCYNYTKGYLHYLKRKNYQFPYDERTDKDPIDDLAIDILGFFLAKTTGGRGLLDSLAADLRWISSVPSVSLCRLDLIIYFHRGFVKQR